MSFSDSTQRFSDRVQDYQKYRPTYPREFVDWLRSHYGLTSDSVIVDVGSGTGISAQLFLEFGCTVYGVEPNEPMRTSAEQHLRSFARFHSVPGTSEHTTLPDHLADLIVVAQAFHWFDPEPTRSEFLRILKPGRPVAILYNDRKMQGSGFTEAYEKLLIDFGRDYAEVKFVNRTEQRHLAFFKKYEEFHVDTFQEFDFEGLLGRLTSSSYAPRKEHPQFAPMLDRLVEIFALHGRAGKVRMEYDSVIFCGTI